jgi:streptogramin lyase
MRRIIIGVSILVLPTAAAILVYLLVGRPTPTNRAAVGLVTTIAGSGAPGGEDGAALAATFSDPFGIAVDKRGNIIVADAGQNNRIRRVTIDGKVETIAGSSDGFADGKAKQAQFNTPSGIAIDNGGNVIIADTSNNRIRRLTTDGTEVVTIAGTGEAGLKDGLRGQAQFDGPLAVAVDKNDSIFIADAYNDCIRRLAKDGQVTTIAGTGTPGFNDGEGGSASFDTPSGVAVDKDGNVFVADTGNRAVRKISTLGQVTTIAGGGNGDGPEPEVRLNRPVGICVSHDGFVFVSDEGGARIIRISPEGEIKLYCGGTAGFSDSAGSRARFNGPSCLAIDRQGVIYVADTQNYLVREVLPDATPRTFQDPALFVQPVQDSTPVKPIAILPKLGLEELNISHPFPWPLNPQNSWHEIAGVVGEARGAAGGIALDHIHSGLDIHGVEGEPALSVFDEKISSPIANSEFNSSGEGLKLGLFTYIHIRVGRNAAGVIESPSKFKPRLGSTGEMIGVRARRGARFKVGDFVGSLNRLNHVHLNLGPWNAQGNASMLPFLGFIDTVSPTIEPNGIEVVPAGSLESPDVTKKVIARFSERRNGRLLVKGDVAIIVTAYDRVDGNVVSRKLGLYKIGYQLLRQDGSPVAGFEQPLMNIEFNRLPPDGNSVFKAYAPGSGVSAYGTPTKFRYIVTNRVRDGEAVEGLLRTSNLSGGNYIIKIVAKDFAGNQVTGPSTELPITIEN